MRETYRRAYEPFSEAQLQDHLIVYKSVLESFARLYREEMDLS